MEDKPPESLTEARKTSTGLEPNLAALLSYLPYIGWVAAIVFYLLEKENKYVRFHALQSIVFAALLFVVSVALRILLSIFAAIPFLGVLFVILASIFWAILGLGSLVIWIILMVKAYSGEQYKLPVIGDIAERNV